MDRDVESHPEGQSEPSVRGEAWRELQTLLGIVLIIAALYWIWRSRKQDPAIFCCLVFAAITYLPVSGVIPLNATIAEHWLYLPSAFLFLAAGLAISRLRLPPIAVGSVLAAWLIFLFLRFRLASRTGPPNWQLERRYIEVLDQNGATPAAITELRSCLRTQWYRAESWQLLSQLLAKIGRTREAMEAFEQAKALDVHLLEHQEGPQP